LPVSIAASDKALIDILKGYGLTDAEAQAEIDEMEGLPPATPMPTERRVEILKGIGFTEEEIQAHINSLPPPSQRPKRRVAGRPAIPMPSNMASTLPSSILPNAAAWRNLTSAK
jgi:hypothetical protein